MRLRSGSVFDGSEAAEREHLGGRAAMGNGYGLAAAFILAASLLLGWAGTSGAADVAELEKNLSQGNEALAKVMPELDSLAGVISRDVLDGKADLHVFYGMAVARIVYEHCQDIISLLRAAQAQGCPALEAALVKQLGDAAIRLEGAAELVAGSLPMTSNPQIGVLGHAAVEALRLYVPPLKEFAKVGRQEL